MTPQSKNLHLTRALAKIANEPTPRAPKPAPKKPCRPLLLTDDQVREARRLHEFKNVSAREIELKFGLSKQYVQSLLSYQTRSKIFP